MMLNENTLRAAIARESAAISELRGKIDEAPLKLLLESASTTLSLVLRGYLGPHAMKPTRTGKELESWLEQAGQHVERASQIRREVEAVVKRG